MIVILGTNTLIGEYFYKKLISNGQDNIFVINEYENLEEKIVGIKEDIKYVICAIEKSYEKNILNTDYIEKNLSENLYFNLELPLKVAKLCKDNKILLGMISNGCLYDNDISSNHEEIDENTSPNLTVSNHSIMHISKEKILNLVNDNILNLRFRYPISGDLNPTCYLSKLISYHNTVLNTNNSVSFLKDIIPLAILLLENKQTGTYNMCNNGFLNSINTLINYKHTIDQDLEINEIQKIEHDKLIGKRSNVIFSNKKLITKVTELKGEEFNIPDAKDSLLEILNNLNDNCKQLKKCLCCQQKGTLKSILNLGYQPLANDFHKMHESCNYYPLHLKYCNYCYHSQLSHAINPIILFKNYKYVSGTSNTGLRFFKENADFISSKFSLEASLDNYKILDIACNDGSQLNYFRDLNWDTYGIDPATNLCPIAEKNGHKIVCDFFNMETAKKNYLDKHIKFDVILAQNVFAHGEFVDSFLQGCKLILKENGILFIQTSQRDMIINCEFDTIYHEHISFFNTKSMNCLVERNGLKLVNVTEHSIHGISYIFEIQLNLQNNIIKNKSNVEKEEEALQLYNPLLYEKFNLSSKNSVEILKIKINNYKSQDYKIIGFGAAAKGQTLICYSNLDLDYIVDENPLKIGYHSPKLNIPIFSIDDFINNLRQNLHQKYVLIILAWNFATEIKEKIKKLYYNNNFNKENLIIIDKYFSDFNKENPI
jgi:2-polyprenyl-3-methyl-5-hydroxy-6-metoxy-1,4-benzoquinol methylase